MNIIEIDKYCDLFEQELKHHGNQSIQGFLFEHKIPKNEELIVELQRVCADYPIIQPEEHDLTRTFSQMQPAQDAHRYVGFEPHAKGGLGEVLTAVDTELNRTVAVKRLHDAIADDLAGQQRFLQEAEITARLEHPGVVPVHGLFIDDAGRPSYVMRLIKGETFHETIKSYHKNKHDPVVFRRLLQTIIQVSQTVAYAHSRGVIHRDIKPKNIMLGKFNETIVVDWGLAKVVGTKVQDPSPNPETTLRPAEESSVDDTKLGSAVGTPAFMSPEQAAGRWDIIDHCSDIYNLGALLYVLLTGRPPFMGNNWPEMQQKIQRGDFPRPHVLKPSTPRALEAICLKAMETNPENRYQSAKKLASEVELWMADEPVDAYRDPVSVKLSRFARKNKTLIASLVCGVIALISLFVSIWIIGLERENTELAAQMRFKNAEAQTNKNTAGWADQRILYQQFDDAVATMVNNISVRSNLIDQGTSPEEIRKHLFEESLKFWDKAIESCIDSEGNPLPRVANYRIQKALTLARAGMHEEAFGLALELKKRKKQLRQNEFYELARVCAICSNPSIENQAQSQQYVDQAIGFLQMAVDDGLRLTEVQLRSEPDFMNLRASPVLSGILDSTVDKEDPRY